MPSYMQLISRGLPLTVFSDGLLPAMITKMRDVVFVNMAVVATLAVAFIIIIGAHHTRR
jgi:hypothetical protein